MLVHSSASPNPVQGLTLELRLYLIASILIFICLKRIWYCVHVGKDSRSGNEELLTYWRPFEDSKPLQGMLFPAAEDRNAVSRLALTSFVTRLFLCSRVQERLVFWSSLLQQRIRLIILMKTKTIENQLY